MPKLKIKISPRPPLYTLSTDVVFTIGVNRLTSEKLPTLLLYIQYERVNRIRTRIGIVFSGKL